MTEKKFGSGDTSWFVKDRFGMFIHWGLYSQPARHEWVKNYEKIHDPDYQKYFEHFEPDLYDPSAWAKAAAAAGMKYFVITTKHHEGFCLWDSQYTDYKATNTPIGRDLLKEMVDAFRAEGIRVGFYYSLIDWHHPHFPIDRIHPDREREDREELNKGRDVSIYAQYMRDQVRELLTNFGQIDIIWFDFSYPGEDGKDHNDWESEKLVKMIRELQPNIIINNRLDIPGIEDIVTPEQYLPTSQPVDDDGNPRVWEGCQTFSGSWGYHRDESSWKSIGMLVHMLIEHVAMNGNLLMNVGPTARGTIDDRALNALQGYADWMKLHQRSIYNCGAAPDGLMPPKDCRYTYNPETNRLYVHLFKWPFKTIHLPGLADKVEYAQLLNDASELLEAPNRGVHTNLAAGIESGDLALVLPIVKPNVTVPVIELFLK